jgi:hypothetical protein
MITTAQALNAFLHASDSKPSGGLHGHAAAVVPDQQFQHFCDAIIVDFNIDVLWFCVADRVG